MNLFKKQRRIRRFNEPIYVNGYCTIPYSEKTLPMHVVTLDDRIMTSEDGSHSVQRIQVFCEQRLLIEDQRSEQKADRLFFNDKWFECVSCKLSDDTILAHYTAEFVECIDQEVER